MEKNSIMLKEARGKTVKNMTVSFDPDYNCVEVEFTDGTCMAVDVVSAVKIRPQSLQGDGMGYFPRLSRILSININRTPMVH